MRVQKHLDDFHRYKQSEKQLMVIDIAKCIQANMCLRMKCCVIGGGCDAYGVCIFGIKWHRKISSKL